MVLFDTGPGTVEVSMVTASVSLRLLRMVLSLIGAAPCPRSRSPHWCGLRRCTRIVNVIPGHQAGG